MAALTCEICGGKLTAKSGGIFECDSCGMQYDKTRVQEMVQEIKGTVKVEGTVEVQGAVRIEGAVRVDNRSDAKNCALRGIQIMETSSLLDGRYDYNKEKRAEVAGVLNDALKIDPTCAEAHIGFLFREYWVSNFDELAEYVRKNAHDIRCSVYYENAEKYSRGTDLHSQLMAVVDDFVKEKIEKDYQEALQLMQQKGYVSAAEIFEKLSGYQDADQLCKKCQEEAKKLHALGEDTITLFRECFPKSCTVVRGNGWVAAITADGGVSLSMSESCPQAYQKEFTERVSQWTEVKQICGCGCGDDESPTSTLIALTKRGRLLAAGMLGSYSGLISSLTDIAWMKSDGFHVALVRKSGELTVIPKIDGMYQPMLNNQIMDWRNISYLSFDAGKGFVLKALNWKTKMFCKVKRDYYYTEILSDISCYEDCSEDTRPTKRPGEYEDLEIHQSFGENIVHKNLVDYYRGEYCFWAVTKNGDVLYGPEYSPKCMSLGAVAMFPGVVDGKCLVLLADGSFVECEMPNYLDHDTTIQIRKIPDFRAFDGLDGLKRIKNRREQLRKDMENEKNTLTSELANLKGLFTGKRRKEIETKLTEIEAELKGL